MKKIYCKPSINAVKINSSNFICNSILQVKSDFYSEETMTDLSRGAGFSTWDDEDVSIIILR